MDDIDAKRIPCEFSKMTQEEFLEGLVFLRRQNERGLNDPVLRDELIEYLVEHYTARVLSIFVCYFPHDRQLCEDLSQNVFIIMTRKLDSIREVKMPVIEAYIKTVVNNEARKHLQRLKARPRIQALSEAEVLPAKGERIKPQNDKKLLETLEDIYRFPEKYGLNEREIEIFVLREEGKSYAEIADILNISNVKARVTFCRAKKKLCVRFGGLKKPFMEGQDHEQI